MKLFKQLVIISSLYTVAMPVFAQGDIAGTYTCTGVDIVSKNNYTSDLTISNQGSIYDMKWHNADGSDYSGIGFMMASNKDQLLAQFKNDKDPSQFGVITYLKGADGNLTGTYARGDSKEMSTETCKKK